MRIRQVKPSFWVDKTMAALPEGTRLAYIGLWMLADDEGFIDWDVEQAAAELYPFESVKRRERLLGERVDQLIDRGRVRSFTDCRCLHIPTLKGHQRVSGVRSTRYAEAHAKHSLLSHKQSPLSDSPGTVGNVTVGNGRERNGTVALGASTFSQKVKRP